MICHFTTLQRVSTVCVPEHFRFLGKSGCWRFKLIAPFSKLLAQEWGRILVFTSLETFAKGWVDTTYFFRFHCFVSMMTGNTIFFGMSLVTEDNRLASPLFYLAMLLSFWLGVLCASILEGRSGWYMPPYIIALIVLYGNYWCIDELTGESSSKWKACFLSPIFGIHASILLKGGLGKYPGIAMTSNSVNFVRCMYIALRRGWRKVPVAQRHDSCIILSNWISMVLGAAGSASVRYFFPADKHHWEMQLHLGSAPAILIMAGLMHWNSSLFKHTRTASLAEQLQEV
eukprot:TRINITY_DN76689_c0_g1_i1.p1 TRINITY_DN76689_c0_g1~~TRINITY_DN76689_c0_g1_i1.p1  ORF type:complete len:286 (-),score=30.14 TRINITY_DN76689_c0_g1_i1:13-870(-)